jgi:unsaturated rhamnogalacturonyl hydrolase
VRNASWRRTQVFFVTCLLAFGSPACSNGGPDRSSVDSGAATGTGSKTDDAAYGPDATNEPGDSASPPVEPAPEAASEQPDVSSADVTHGDGGTDGATGPLSPTVLQSMRQVADWQLAAGAGAKDWIDGAFWTGVLATYKSTNDAKYLTAIKNWAGAGWGLNGGAGARGDNQCPAQTFFETYLLDPVPANMVMLNGAKPSFDALVANTPAGRVEWWWEDALFMVPPGFARLGAAVGDKKYFATMNAMYWDTYAFLFAPQVGLMYRDNGTRGQFWARGNGWVMAGAARVLEYLPIDDPKRPDFIKLIQTMAAALAKVQGADGLWRSNLMNPNQFPNPETSGTGFFTFAIAWGINSGILDQTTYLPIAKKGWDGLVSHVDATGKLGYVQPVGAGPNGAAANGTAPYGVGAFLLAGSEMAKLLP